MSELLNRCSAPVLPYMARQRARTPPPYSLCIDANLFSMRRGEGPSVHRPPPQRSSRKELRGFEKRGITRYHRGCVCCVTNSADLSKLRATPILSLYLTLAKIFFSSSISMRMNPQTLWLTIKGEIRVVVGLILRCVSALAQAHKVSKSFFLFSFKRECHLVIGKGISSIRGSHKYVITYARCPKS